MLLLPDWPRVVLWHTCSSTPMASTAAVRKVVPRGMARRRASSTFKREKRREDARGSCQQRCPDGVSPTVVQLGMRQHPLTVRGSGRGSHPASKRAGDGRVGGGAPPPSLGSRGCEGAVEKDGSAKGQGEWRHFRGAKRREKHQARQGRGGLVPTMTSHSEPKSQTWHCCSGRDKK